MLLPAHGGSPYERLASDPLNLSTDQRTSLIAAIFSDRSEVEKIRRLCKNDAQILVDIIYEVRRTLYRPGAGFADSRSGFCSLSIRRWGTSITRYEQGVCAFCARFVAAKPFSRDHSPS